MLKATRFMRQPFFIMGFEVTEDNMDEIAKWCEGHVIRETDRPFVRVPVNRPLTEKQTRAYVGTFVTVSKQRGEKSFKVYQRESLDRDFFELPDDEIEAIQSNPCCGGARPPTNVGVPFRPPTVK